MHTIQITLEYIIAITLCIAGFCIWITMCISAILLGTEDENPMYILSGIFIFIAGLWVFVRLYNGG